MGAPPPATALSRAPLSLRSRPGLKLSAAKPAIRSGATRFATLPIARAGRARGPDQPKVIGMQILYSDGCNPASY